MWPFKKKVWEEPKWYKHFGPLEVVYECGCCGAMHKADGPCCSKCGCTNRKKAMVRRLVSERADLEYGYPISMEWFVCEHGWGHELSWTPDSIVVEKRTIVYEYQDACPKCGTPVEKESD